LLHLYDPKKRFARREHDRSTRRRGSTRRGLTVTGRVGGDLPTPPPIRDLGGMVGCTYIVHSGVQARSIAIRRPEALWGQNCSECGRSGGFALRPVVLANPHLKQG
jgi:hypothetical protein